MIHLLFGKPIYSIGIGSLYGMTLNQFIKKLIRIISMRDSLHYMHAFIFIFCDNEDILLYKNSYPT